MMVREEGLTIAPILKNRYVPHDRLIETDSGVTVWKGKDKSLHREAILYMFPNTSREADLSFIGQRAHLSGTHFMHILDAGLEGSQVVVVLKNVDGAHLLHKLGRHTFSAVDAMRMVLELGSSVEQAMAAQPTGFSVTADNLWLRGAGDLMVLNYWSEGQPGRQGADGLCALLLQLLLKTENVPAFFDKKETEAVVPALSRQLPAHEARHISRLFRKRGSGTAELGAFLAELRHVIQAWPGNYERAADSRIDVPPTVGGFTAHERREPEPEEKEEAAKRANIPKEAMFIGIPIAGLIAVVGLMFMLTYGPWPGKKEVVTGSLPAASAQPPPSDKPAETPAAMKPPAETKEAGTIVQAPALVGISREEAEKKALAAGLRYEYVLESNAQSVKGTVFKQEPAPGTAIEKGTRVKFWVNNGR